MRIGKIMIIVMMMVMLIVMIMVMRSTLTGYCQCNKVCGSPLTYAGDGNQVVADPEIIIMIMFVEIDLWRNC